jgi:hypothetical protein
LCQISPKNCRQWIHFFATFQFDYEILSKFNKRKIAREQQQENDGQAANGVKV